MHSLALALGLTAALYAFLLRHLVYWLPLPIPSYITVVICMVAAWLVSTNLARRLEPDESPPEWAWTSRALVFAAGLYLLMELLRKFSYFRILDYKDWVMLVTLALTVRYLKPRAMLFLGVLAFAMQLGLTQILGLLGVFIKFPDWVVYLLNLGVAAWVAHWLCFLPDVATDRVKSLDVLWFFGAAGVATMFVGADDFMFRSWTESLISLSYLVSFLLLIRHIGEGEEESEGESAGWGLLITMFVALYLTFIGVFQVQEMLITILPWSALQKNWHTWLPFLVCVALAIGTLVLLKLPRRLRNDAPGRKALLWGTILMLVCVLLGGSIYGASGAGDSGSVVDFFGTIIIFAIVVGPIAVVAQFLLGVGLLRQVFHLRPPPRD